MKGKTFGEVLAMLRAEKGLSMNEVAKRAGLSTPTVSALEQGRSQPSLATAVKVARVFNVGVEWFVDEGRDER